MNCNVGGAERVVRILLGVAFLSLAIFADFPLWGKTAAYLVGVVALVTGAVGVCPAWKLLGINTCSSRA